MYLNDKHSLYLWYITQSDVDVQHRAKHEKLLVPLYGYLAYALKLTRAVSRLELFADALC